MHFKLLIIKYSALSYHLILQLYIYKTTQLYKFFNRKQTHQLFAAKLRNNISGMGKVFYERATCKKAKLLESHKFCLRFNANTVNKASFNQKKSIKTNTM